MFIRKSKLKKRLQRCLNLVEEKNKKFKMLEEKFKKERENMDLSEKLDILEEQAELRGELRMLLRETEFIVGL